MGRHVNPRNEDLTGKRFGKLMAIEHAGKLYGSKAAWLVLLRLQKRKGHDHPQFATREKLRLHQAGTRLPPGETALNRVYDAHERNALVRKLEQSLTREQFKALCLGDCVYCDSPPSTVSQSRRRTSTFLRNGVDRWDNSKGYTVENSVSCCTNCNYGKKTRADRSGWPTLSALQDIKFRRPFPVKPSRATQAPQKPAASGPWRPENESRNCYVVY